ncbi:hypothetical protein ACFJGW_00785 [Burkholderiaceae bacterium UC74_6]
MAYTNQLDFYWGTRPSSPVINRIRNPLFWRVPGAAINPRTGRGTKFVLSFEHKSNGQVFDVAAQAGAATAQSAYAARDWRSLDAISRSMNYVALQGWWTYGNWDWKAKVHGPPWQKEMGVTWGPLADRRLSISNYEVAALRGGYWMNSLGRPELTGKVGSSGLKHDSLDVSFEFDDGLPWYIQLHLGPLSTLSSYT